MDDHQTHRYGRILSHGLARHSMSQSQLVTLGALAEAHEDAAAVVLVMQGTFYRAFSLVNSGREIESDLFDGIRCYCAPQLEIN